MDPLTMPEHVPVEHLRERRRVGRRRLGWLFGNNMPGCRIQGGQPPRACERRQQILKRLSLAKQLFGQPHGEGAFDPKEELRTRQAVESPVTLKGTVQSGTQRSPPSRVKFMGEALCDLYQRNARVVAQLYVRYLFHASVHAAYLLSADPCKGGRISPDGGTPRALLWSTAASLRDRL